MTKSEALRRVNQAQREAAAGAIKHGYPSEEMGPFQQQKFSEAILTAVAEERERWIKLAPWWTGRALQSPEDIRRLAVAEERDRCAGIADAAARLATSGPPLVYITAQQFAADLAKDIADGVRQGLPAPERQPKHADTLFDVDEAVAKERARCAMVARRYNPESWCHANLAVSYNTAQNIADIISGKIPDRQPEPPEKADG
jgi:hypothetical protein